MSKLKIMGLVALTLFALSALGSSSASAITKAEFLKENTKKEKVAATGVTFTTKSAAGPELNTPSLKVKIKCTAASSAGKITGLMTIESSGVTFTGCEGTNGEGEKCKTKSPGAKNQGEIITVALTGELGQVASTESATEVGLNLKPTAGSTFVEVEGSCLPISPTKITGSIAGEATPKNVLSKEGKLVFALSGTKQKIKTVNLLPFGTGTKDKPVLIAFLVESTQTQTENVTYSESVELKVS